MEKKSVREIIAVILKAVTLAMGVACAGAAMLANQ